MSFDTRFAAVPADSTADDGLPALERALEALFEDEGRAPADRPLGDARTEPQPRVR